MTDAELIEATRRGERDAFGLLVARYQRMVEAAVFVTTRRRDLVDDVVQDTFVSAWRTIDQLRDPSRVRPWLYGIARNLACKARRRHRREDTGGAIDIAVGELDGASATPTPFEAVRDAEQSATIAVALARLPDRYREPLVLFYYEHCSVKEVADALDLREDAVMQRISRARRKLGETLAADVEIDLERRPSRAALGVAVLALLPLRTSVAEASTSTSVSWLAMHWRIPSVIAASAAALVVLVAATEQSNAVAAREASKTASAQPPSAATPKPASPRMPPDGDPTRVYRNVSVASLDPVESCMRAARGVVIRALGGDALVRRGQDLFYEPTPELTELANEIAANVASTCDIGTWPELYVICEGTPDELRAGNVGCYPYDPFADG